MAAALATVELKQRVTPRTDPAITLNTFLDTTNASLFTIRTL